MKPKRQKRRWAFWGVAAAAVAGLLYIAVPTKQVGPQPDGTDLTAKTDTARTMQPRETEMEEKADSVEIMRDEPRPMQSRKRRLRKTEPTINDYAKTYTLMADAAKGLQEAEEQIAQCRQELTEARLLSLGYVPVEQEDGTILYINDKKTVPSYILTNKQSIWLMKNKLFLAAGILMLMPLTSHAQAFIKHAFNALITSELAQVESSHKLNKNPGTGVKEGQLGQRESLQS